MHNDRYSAKWLRYCSNNMFTRFKSIIKFLTLVFIMLEPTMLFAAEVVICSRSVAGKKMKCVLRTDFEKKIEKNEQVIIYNKRGSWVATGTVVKIKGSHFIAAFDGSDPIGRGYDAEIVPSGFEGTLSYESSFGK